METSSPMGWAVIQEAVFNLAEATQLGAVLMITGRDEITRSYTFEENTVVISRNNNRERYNRIKPTA